MTPNSAPSYWLLKTEPSTYSIEQLKKDRKTNWNGIRNFQARNHLRKMSVGDICLIYHSGDDKAVVGIAEVIREAYKESDPEDPKGDWSQVDLKYVRTLSRPIPLAEIKSTAALKNIPLIRQSRLSVMPIQVEEFKILTRES